MQEMDATPTSREGKGGRVCGQLNIFYRKSAESKPAVRKGKRQKLTTAKVRNYWLGGKKKERKKGGRRLFLQLRPKEKEKDIKEKGGWGGRDPDKFSFLNLEKSGREKKIHPYDFSGASTSAGGGREREGFIAYLHKKKRGKRQVASCPGKTAVVNLGKKGGKPYAWVKRKGERGKPGALGDRIQKKHREGGGKEVKPAHTFPTS